MCRCSGRGLRRRWKVVAGESRRGGSVRLVWIFRRRSRLGGLSGGRLGKLSEFG